MRPLPRARATGGSNYDRALAGSRRALVEAVYGWPELARLTSIGTTQA